MTTIVFAVVLGTGLGVFALSLSKEGTPNPSGGDISVSASGSGNQSSMKAGGDAPKAGTTDESKENKDEKVPLAVYQPLLYRLGNSLLKKEQMT